jgi:hypothetical protein
MVRDGICLIKQFPLGNNVPIFFSSFFPAGGPFDGYGRFLTAVVYNPPSPQNSVADFNYSEESGVLE